MKKILGLFLSFSMILGAVPAFALSDAEALQSEDNMKIEETSQSNETVVLQKTERKAPDNMSIKNDETKSNFMMGYMKKIYVNFVNEEGTTVKHIEAVNVPETFTASILGDLVPEKYEIKNPYMSYTIDYAPAGINVVVIKNEPISRSLWVRYIESYTGNILEEEEINVTYGTTLIKVSDLKKIPDGYRIVNDADFPISDSTMQINILVEKETEKPETEKFDVTVSFVEEKTGKIIYSFVYENWDAAANGYQLILLDPKGTNATLNEIGYELKNKDKNTVYNIDKDTHYTEIPVLKLENEKEPVNTDNKNQGSTINKTSIAAAKTPRTGDDSNFILYVVFAGATVLSLFAVKRKLPKHDA